MNTAQNKANTQQQRNTCANCDRLSVEKSPTECAQVVIDQLRMNESLKSPTYTLPNGLSSDEIIAYICKSCASDSQ